MPCVVQFSSGRREAGYRPDCAGSRVELLIWVSRSRLLPHRHIPWPFRYSDVMFVFEKSRVASRTARYRVCSRLPQDMQGTFTWRLAITVAFFPMVAACGGASATAPSTTPQPSTPSVAKIDPSILKPSMTYTIGFSSLRDNRAPFSSHTESGFTVSVVSADWIAVTTYGNPQPFIEFNGPAGVTRTGELRIIADGATPFWLKSVDFYSSTTKIPYVIEGFLNADPVFSVVDVIGNTFGAFARRPNPNADMPVQEIRIRLSNPSAPCCANPMGVDNIVVSR
jgi:hypothetical protein